jgi:hypothetical protein
MQLVNIETVKEKTKIVKEIKENKEEEWRSKKMREKEMRFNKQENR